MIKASVGNFLVVTVMAILGILLAKSVVGLFPVNGLTELVWAV